MTGRKSNLQFWRKQKTPKPPKSAVQSAREAVSNFNSDSLSLLSSAKFTQSRPRTGTNTALPSTARPRTGISSVNNQDIVCAITESRGVTPVIGIALLNLSTCETILWQINDGTQYTRTLETISVYEPQIIVIPAFGNTATKMSSIIEACYGDISRLESIDRQYFTEASGIELLQQLARPEDYEAMRTQSLTVNYFAVCCFAAVCDIYDSSSF
jgi:DNA mismatch repair protein MSH4